MRLVVKRLILYTVTAFLVLLVVIKFRSPTREVKLLNGKCQVLPEIADNLIVLMADTHKILKQLQITHFLCYGTLWGVLKMQMLLPWEDNVEFCAVNEELSRFEEAYLIKMFRKNNLVLSYDSQDGVYEVYRPDKLTLGILRIIVFEKDPELDMMKRVGWSRRLLPPDCDYSPSLHCFPPRLIEPPLPVAIVNQIQYHVPREEVEIQKYLYPDTWWKEVKPSQC